MFIHYFCVVNYCSHSEYQYEENAEGYKLICHMTLANPLTILYPTTEILTHMHLMMLC